MKISICYSEYIIPAMKQGDGSIMLLQCFFTVGNRKLVKEGKMDRDEHCAILEDYLLETQETGHYRA